MDAGLGKVEVTVEYGLPLSSKRVDAVLSGVHPKTGEDSHVVVELKQWSKAKAWDEDPTLVQVDAPYGPLLHPVLQVRDYCEYIGGFVSSVQEQQIRGAAYLHNADDESVADLFELPGTPTANSSPGSAAASSSISSAPSWLRSPVPRRRTGCTPGAGAPAGS
ncbi:hypothetical protein ACFQXA_16625 [Nocardiopsis composta]